MEKVANVILMAIFAIGVTIFNGFVLSELWGWFLTPIGVPSIGIAQAMGIGLLISLFVMRLNIATNEKLRGWTLLGTILVIDLVFWGYGALLTLFM